MVKLKIFEAKQSLVSLESEFQAWQKDTPGLEVVSVQTMPAGVAFSTASWVLHVWYRKRTAKNKPEAPMVSTR